MTSPSDCKHGFPLQFRPKGRAVVLRPLTTDDRESMIRLAHSLPENDLLFLDRDITQPVEIDRWVGRAATGDLVTTVAWEEECVVGYAICDRGSVRWTSHVAELRVMVAESARGIGIGRLLLERAFETALDEGVIKVIARMTPEQSDAQRLFKRLGFEEEAVLHDHAMDEHGITHDLLVLAFHTRKHQEQRCASCGTLVLSALSLDGFRLCSHCYESRYEELGGGG